MPGGDQGVRGAIQRHVVVLRLTVAALYSDRADCENNFDALKHHWGWGGFTTHDIKCPRLMARMIALGQKS